MNSCKELCEWTNVGVRTGTQINERGLHNAVTDRGAKAWWKRTAFSNGLWTTIRCLHGPTVPTSSIALDPSCIVGRELYFHICLSIYLSGPRPDFSIRRNSKCSWLQTWLWKAQLEKFPKTTVEEIPVTLCFEEFMIHARKSWVSWTLLARRLSTL